MLLDSVIIMLIGMGVVFSFLIIMIFVMTFTSKVLTSPTFLKYFPQPKPAPAAIPVKTGNETEMEEIAAAIAIAKANSWGEINNGKKIN